MEFIIVMPIYFLLLGTVFVVGELSLHSIHLSASGDRSAAFAEKVDSIFWAGMRQVLCLERNDLRDRATSAHEFSYQGDIAYQGEASVSEFRENNEQERRKVLPDYGFWTEAIAGRVKDNYTLSPLTRGVIAHWFYETERRVYDDDLMADKLERSDEDSIDTILDKDSGSLGRVRMQGNYYKDGDGVTIRDYGYFSLRRRKSSRWEDESQPKPYRFWDPAELASETWKKAAYRDEFQTSGEYYEAQAKVNVDSELYVNEGAGDGTELQKATEPGSRDGGVQYDFKGLL